MIYCSIQYSEKHYITTLVYVLNGSKMLNPPESAASLQITLQLVYYKGTCLGEVSIQLCSEGSRREEMDKI